MSKRILIVEDEALLAIEVAQELSFAGFTIVGPAATVAKALDLICKIGCDVAILDVNIQHETSETIALALRAVGVPFFFLSGISKDQHQLWMANVPLVPKPVDFDALFEALYNCISSVISPERVIPPESKGLHK